MSEDMFVVSKWVDERVQGSVMPIIEDVPGMSWDKWRVAFQSAYLKDNKLGQAIAKNPNSALRALVQCAQLGLSPDPALKHFALVPFGGEVNGLVQWQGWQHLALTSGRVVDGTITAEVIYKQEDKNRMPGVPLVDPATNRVNHVPEFFERDSWQEKDIVGAYAQAQVLNGPWVSLVMSRRQIQKRLDMGAGTAAKNWYAEMCKAKVLGALLRSGRVPLSARARAVFSAEDDAEAIVQAEVVPVEPTPPPQPAIEAPTGSEVMFNEMDRNPFPSDEEMQASLTKAVEAEFDRQKLTEKQRHSVIGSVAADASLDQLTKDELGFLLDKLTKK